MNNVIELQAERRRRRSANTYEAIRLQLEHIYKTQNLRSFALGDTRGLTLSWAGHSSDAEILSAYAPILATCVDRDRRAQIFDRLRTFIPEASEQTLEIRTFTVDGETLHLVVMSQSTVKHTDLYRAVSGVRRIFGQAEWAA